MHKTQCGQPRSKLCAAKFHIFSFDLSLASRTGYGTMKPADAPSAEVRSEDQERDPPSTGRLDKHLRAYLSACLPACLSVCLPETHIQHYLGSCHTDLHTGVWDLGPDWRFRLWSRSAFLDCCPDWRFGFWPRLAYWICAQIRVLAFCPNLRFGSWPRSMF